MRFPLVRRPRVDPAVVLGILAVTIATSGTAVAATGTIVNIADGSVATNVARVDATGALKVGDGAAALTVDGTVSSRAQAPSTPLNTGAYVSKGTVALLAPTTATLAVTRLSVFNSARNRSYPDTDWVVSLSKGVYETASSSCRSPSSPATMLRAPAGSTSVDSYPTPLVFKATGSERYCVMVTVRPESGIEPGAFFQPFVQLTGFVVSGTYTGSGAGSSGAAAPTDGAADGGAPPFRAAGGVGG